MAKENPNILFILTDQHRLSAVGAYGRTPCRTPNIDRLAEEGVRFEKAYTVCPVCTPTRATIMTGELPHNHGMIQNVEDFGSPVHELNDSPHLLSRLLQTGGYQLGYTGKWHLGSENRSKLGAEIKPCLPKDVGFTGQNFPGHGSGGWGYSEFRDYLERRGLKHRIRPWCEKTVPYRHDEPGGILEQPVEGTVAYYLAQHTIDLIDRLTGSSGSEPFFIWHNFWGPHSPYLVTDEYIDMYRGVDIPEWPNYDWPARDIPGPHQLSITPQLLYRQQNLSWQDWAMAIRYYYAFTTLIDAQIGRMIEHLRERGILDKTVVIFSGDHGESLGDHGGIYNKGWTHFEETHRIPLIIRMPDGCNAGTVIDELVSLADIYPTVLELAGQVCPPPTPRPQRPANWPYEKHYHPDGVSLMPLVRGQKVQWREEVVSEFHGLYDNNCIMRTLRHGQYKYGYTFLGLDELYDLNNDPYEINNLIDSADHADVVADLQLRLYNWMCRTEDPALSGFHMLRLGGREMP